MAAALFIEYLSPTTANAVTGEELRKLVASFKTNRIARTDWSKQQVQQVRKRRRIIDGAGEAGLWLLNSNRYGRTAWQLDWLWATRTALAKTSAPPVPSLAFYHIPLLEQRTLHEPGRTAGVSQEGVCHEEESGVAAPVLAADTRLLACFCGHDHINDCAVRSRSLDLVYGRATGHAGYGADKLRKDAKLIELDLRAGQYQQVSCGRHGRIVCPRVDWCQPLWLD